MDGGINHYYFLCVFYNICHLMQTDMLNVWQINMRVIATNMAARKMGIPHVHVGFSHVSVVAAISNGSIDGKQLQLKYS